MKRYSPNLGLVVVSKLGFWANLIYVFCVELEEREKKALILFMRVVAEVAIHSGNTIKYIYNMISSYLNTKNAFRKGRNETRVRV